MNCEGEEEEADGQSIKCTKKEKQESERYGEKVTSDIVPDERVTSEIVSIEKVTSSNQKVSTRNVTKRKVSKNHQQLSSSKVTPKYQPRKVTSRRRHHSFSPFKMMPVMIAMMMRSFLVSSQNQATPRDCFGGIETFEKVSMVDFDPATPPAGLLLSQPDQALTRDCINLCRQQPSCLSFALDYFRFRCAAYSVSSPGSSPELPSSRSGVTQSSLLGSNGQANRPGYRDKDRRRGRTGNRSSGRASSAEDTSSRNGKPYLIPSNSTNFFEKVCFKGVPRDEYEKVCGPERLWAFERVPNSYLDGHDRLILSNVGSRSECEKSCLMETQFICRSANYESASRICTLSKEDRRSQAGSFKTVLGSGYEYLENQCAAPGPMTCLYETRRDVGVITMDSLVFATNAEDCQFKCDKEHTFNCRSFSIEDKRCFLSGDDAVSLSSTPPSDKHTNLSPGSLMRANLPTKKGSLYGEKKCVTEQCTTGVFTYEKITGYTLRSAIESTIPLKFSGKLGITKECREYCDGAHVNCPSFSVNYLTSRCEQLDRNTQGRILDLVPQEGASLYEKICLRVPEIQSVCQEKFFAFERVIGHELTPNSYLKMYNFVQSRRDCQEYCLHEKDFICRSAVYNEETTECKLSPDDRRSNPHSYVRNNNHKVSYLENQCIKGHSTCPFIETSNAYPTYTDVVERESVDSVSSCRKYCNDNKRFLCRSFAYYGSNNQCFLSGDDTVSAGSTALQSRSGMTYFERKCSLINGTILTGHGDHGHAHDDSDSGERTNTGHGSREVSNDSTERHGGHRHGITEPEIDTSAIGSGTGSSSSSSSEEMNTHGLVSGRSEGSSVRSESISSSSGHSSSPTDHHSATGHSSVGDHSIDGGHHIDRSNLDNHEHAEHIHPDHHPVPGTGSRTSGGSTFPAGDQGGSHLSSSAVTPGGGRSGVTSGGREPVTPYGVVGVTLPPGGRSHGSTPLTEGINDGHSSAEDGRPRIIVSNVRPVSEQETTTTVHSDRGHSSTSTTTRTPSSGHRSRDKDRNHDKDRNVDKDKNERDGAGHSPGSHREIPKCPPHSKFTFERVPNFEPVGGYLNLLYIDSNNPGIVTECTNRCIDHPHCLAFILDYNHKSCHGIFENSSIGRFDLRLSIGKDYFEGFCVPEHLTCKDKLWHFDRIVDQSVVGSLPKSVIRFTSRRECKIRCLEERRFPCSSATYDSYRSECRLFDTDRHSGMIDRTSGQLDHHLRLVFTKGIDYMENQCSFDPKSCHFLPYERDLSMIAISKSVRGSSSFFCEQECINESSFNCRSFTYVDQSSVPGANLCLLSADSRKSSQKGATAFRPRALYGERECFGFKGRSSLSHSGSGSSAPISSSHPSSSHASSLAPGRDLSGSSHIAPPGGSQSRTADREGRWTNNPLPTMYPTVSSYPFFTGHGDHSGLIPSVPFPGPPSSGHYGSSQSYGSSSGSQPYGSSGSNSQSYGSSSGASAGMMPPGMEAIDINNLFTERERADAMAMMNLPPGHLSGLGSLTPSIGSLSPNGQGLSPHLPGGSRDGACADHQYTFEKTFGYDIRYTRKERSRLPPRLGIGIQCQDECLRRGYRCNAFIIEYGPAQNCFFLEDTGGDGSRSNLQKVMDVAYFEKVCLKNPTCGKLWTFERVIGHFLDEAPEKEVQDVLNRVLCQDHCLGEKSFQCKSATYDYKSKLCRLFTETRRSRPHSFKSTLPNEDMDYFENQCVKEPPTCQYKDHNDHFFPYVDRLTHAFSLVDCQRQCDAERTFPCRSISYETYARDCALSSEDTHILGVPTPSSSSLSSSSGSANGSSSGLVVDGLKSLILQSRRHSIYSEKGNCESVSVQCTQQDMILTVNFDSPFTGRIYAKGNPSQCYVLGTGANTLQFAISLGSKCGTKPEGDKNYANEVVVQQHPIIMTESDRTIRVLCQFEFGDQTVTLSSSNNLPGIDVHKKSHLFSADSTSGSPIAIMDERTRLTSEPPVTSLVTNTAAPPSVIMRILDRTQKDATIVGMGDELTLQIELRDPTQSAFGIFARNLYARSTNGESLFLLDNTGCPTDPTIFPALELDPKSGKTLYAVFKAFRFPSTGIVNFEVQVKFCQDKCDSVKCSPTNSLSGSIGLPLESYGRRRKRRSLSFNGASSGLDTSSRTEKVKESESSESSNNSTTEVPTTETIDTQEFGPEVTTVAMKFDDIVSNISNVSNQSEQVEITTIEPLPVPESFLGPTLVNSSVDGAGSRSLPMTGAPSYYSYPQANYMTSSSYQGQMSPMSNGQPMANDQPLSGQSMSNPYGGHQSADHVMQATNNNWNPYSRTMSTPGGNGQEQYTSGLPGHQGLYANYWNNRWSGDNGTMSNSMSMSNSGQTGTGYWSRVGGATGQSPPYLILPPPQTTVSSNGQVGSGPMIVHSSRPLPSSEKGKFKPPRPLPRPKNTPTLTSTLAPSRDGVGGETLSATIMVGEKDEKMDSKSGTKSWTIERGRGKFPDRYTKESCNTGPAILLTAIVVSLLHVGVVIGGYVYYRKFGYASSVSRILSNVGVSTFGGGSGLSNSGKGTTGWSLNTNGWSQNHEVANGNDVAFTNYGSSSHRDYLITPAAFLSSSNDFAHQSSSTHAPSSQPMERGGVTSIGGGATNIGGGARNERKKAPPPSTPSANNSNVFYGIPGVSSTNQRSSNQHMRNTNAPLSNQSISNPNYVSQEFNQSNNQNRRSRDGATYAQIKTSNYRSSGY